MSTANCPYGLLSNILSQSSTLIPFFPRAPLGTQQVVNNQAQKRYSQCEANSEAYSIAALDDVKQVTYNKIALRITLAVKCILPLWYTQGNDNCSRRTRPQIESEVGTRADSRTIRSVLSFTSSIALNLSENMTKDVINRAIARGEPRTLGTNVSFVTYEVMLPGGVALVM